MLVHFHVAPTVPWHHTSNHSSDGSNAASSKGRQKLHLAISVNHASIFITMYSALRCTTHTQNTPGTPLTVPVHLVAQLLQPSSSPPLPAKAPPPTQPPPPSSAASGKLGLAQKRSGALSDATPEQPKPMVTEPPPEGRSVHRMQILSWHMPPSHGVKHGCRGKERVLNQSTLACTAADTIRLGLITHSLKIR